MMHIEKSPVSVVATHLRAESQQAGNALNEILATLIKSDPQLYCDFTTAAPNIILSGSGEMHLQKTLTQLRKLCPFAIQASDPYVLYRETVGGKSRDNPQFLGMVRTPKNTNQFFAYAEPLSEDLIEDIEKGMISHLSQQECAAYLHTKHGWDLNEARKVWSWGPAHHPANCLIDGTKDAAAIPNQVKQNCIVAFNDVCVAGVLAREPLRGIKVVITRAVLASDERQHGGAQIIPTFRNLILGLSLISSPRLLEPTYRVKLTTQTNYVPEVKALLLARRGIDINEYEPETTNELDFYLPVPESFGLIEKLQTVTANTVSVELTFSHWEILTDDIFLPSSLNSRYIHATRKRKGIVGDFPPPVSMYLDKP